MEQPRRQRCPGHRDWAKLKLGMRGRYGTTRTTKMPRTPRLGQTEVGDEGKLWDNRGGIEVQATEIGPNLCWECGQAMEKPGRQRCPGHRDWAKPKMRMRERYGTTGAAEMPRPQIRGQTYVGNKESYGTTGAAEMPRPPRLGNT